MRAQRPTVGLFVTCLIDTMRPSVGFAAVKLLERAGCDVIVPARQTCCGQPAFNSGDNRDAKPIARQVIDAFAAVDYVVVPSGSCAGTIKVHYPELFADEPRMASAVKRLAERTWEITSFLTDVMKMSADGETYRGVATYHDSCSGMRELGVKAQPRALLAGVAGLTLKELRTPEVCCGFGGLFCVKYPEISEKMVDAKVDDVLATGADTLLGGDLGCLLNIAGRLSRRGAEVRVRHVAEVLAGATAETPPIGSTTNDRETPRRQP
jgi:L-lactate dehydrogenase complex protein LldE